jgi:hypothetical protein
MDTNAPCSDGYTALVTQNIRNCNATEPGKLSQSGGVILRKRAQVDRRRTHSPKSSGKQRTDLGRQVEHIEDLEGMYIYVYILTYTYIYYAHPMIYNRQ